MDNSFSVSRLICFHPTEENMCFRYSLRFVSAVIFQNSSDVREEFQLNNLAGSYYFVFNTKPMSWGLLVMINTNLYLSIAYALFSTTQIIYRIAHK